MQEHRVSRLSGNGENDSGRKDKSKGQVTGG